MTQKVATGGTPSKAPSQLHDLTVARDTGVIGPLNWAASQLDLPT